jgi:hypothetical protein
MCSFIEAMNNNLKCRVIIFIYRNNMCQSKHAVKQRLYDQGIEERNSEYISVIINMLQQAEVRTIAKRFSCTVGLATPHNSAVTLNHVTS